MTTSEGGQGAPAVYGPIVAPARGEARLGCGATRRARQGYRRDAHAPGAPFAGLVSRISLPRAVPLPHEGLTPPLGERRQEAARGHGTAFAKRSDPTADFVHLHRWGAWAPRGIGGAPDTSGAAIRFTPHGRRAVHRPPIIPAPLGRPAVRLDTVGAGVQPPAAPSLGVALQVRGSELRVQQGGGRVNTVPCPQRTL